MGERELQRKKERMRESEKERENQRGESLRSQRWPADCGADRLRPSHREARERERMRKRKRLIVDRPRERELERGWAEELQAYKSDPPSSAVHGEFCVPFVFSMINWGLGIWVRYEWVCFGIGWELNGWVLDWS